MAFGEFMQETAVKLGPALHPESGRGLRIAKFFHARLPLSHAVYWRRSHALSLRLDRGDGALAQTPRLRGRLLQECAPPLPPWPAHAGRLFRHSTNKECA